MTPSQTYGVYGSIFTVAALAQATGWSPPSAGDGIIAITGSNGSRGITACGYGNSGVPTVLTEVTAARTALRIYAWYGTVTGLEGDQTITGTASGNMGGDSTALMAFVIPAAQWLAAQTGIQAAVSAGLGSGAGPWAWTAGPVTPGTASNLIVGFADRANRTYTEDPDYTNVSLSGNNLVHGGYIAQLAATAQGLDFTASDANGDAALAVIAFVAQSAGGGPVGGASLALPPVARGRAFLSQMQSVRSQALLAAPALIPTGWGRIWELPRATLTPVRLRTHTTGAMPPAVAAVLPPKGVLLDRPVVGKTVRILDRTYANWYVIDDTVPFAGSLDATALKAARKGLPPTWAPGSARILLSAPPPVAPLFGSLQYLPPAPAAPKITDRSYVWWVMVDDSVPFSGAGWVVPQRAATRVPEVGADSWPILFGAPLPPPGQTLLHPVLDVPRGKGPLSVAWVPQSWPLTHPTPQPPGPPLNRAIFDVPRGKGTALPAQAGNVLPLYQAAALIQQPPGARVFLVPAPRPPLRALGWVTGPNPLLFPSGIVPVFLEGSAWQFLAGWRTIVPGRE